MELHGLFMTLDKLLGELRSATMTFREKSEKMRPLKYRIAEEIEELRYSLAARLERLREYRLSAEVHLAEFGRADDDGEADGDGQPDNDDEDAWETEEDDGVQPFLFYP
jgi:chromatin segregation and condensation protein Rec8/ScpA/Scc1 (kleisin family)